MRCPIGLLVTPDVIEVFRDTCTMWVSSRVLSSLPLGRESFTSTANRIRGVSSPLTIISGENDIWVPTHARNYRLYA